MKSKTVILSVVLIALFVLGCAPKSVSYDLPSVETVEQPEWVRDASGKKDSVFLVIIVDLENDSDMARAIQNAQSELSKMLTVEIQDLLMEYFKGSGETHSEEVAFKKMSALPQTLERIMTLITVEDAWERSGEVAVLCAFDHVDVSTVIMRDMDIDDKNFLTLFKMHMNAIANKHQ